MKNRVISGFGYACGKRQVFNDEMRSLVDTSDEWIVTRTGIQSRYISEYENTSELGYQAACMAIENSQIDVHDIDLIVVATMTPDHFTPSCACLIQEKLGLNGCDVRAFDLNAACSGFVYAMEVVDALLERYHHALVIGAEVLSKLVDFKDRSTCVLFGDGAGAVILSRKPTTSSLEFYTRSIGDHLGILKAQGPNLKGLNNELSHGYLTMNGSEVFRFAIFAMKEAIEEVLKQSGHHLNEIDLIIPHQANARIIQSVAKRLMCDMNRFYVNVNEFGNTSAASIPIALAKAKEEGKLKEGMKVICVGFGGGFTYGAFYIEV